MQKPFKTFSWALCLHFSFSLPCLLFPTSFARKIQARFNGTEQRLNGIAKGTPSLGEIDEENTKRPKR
jgi:hypothetical protein